MYRMALLNYLHKLNINCVPYFLILNKIYKFTMNFKYKC